MRSNLAEIIHSFMDTLPKIISSDDTFCLCFDRGYGTMKFIEEITSKKYKVSIIATTVGSRHPFLFKYEMQNFIKTCLDKDDTLDVVVSNVNLFSK